MSGLTHVDAEVADRETYLSAVGASRRLAGSDYADRPDDKARDEASAAHLQEGKFQAMLEAEEFILTMTEDGFGRRVSAYEFRISGRSGQGIRSIDLSRGEGTTKIIASFPVLDSDQIVMVTDGGQLIRCPVKDISFMGRTTRGVTLFKTAEDENVVSVTRLRDVDDDDEGESDDEAGETSDETVGDEVEADS